MIYFLDSNTFIEAKNRFYSFDLCPGFWEWLETFPEVNSILTISQVKEELLEPKDELSRWVNKLPKNFFMESSIEIQYKLKEIVNYVQSSYNKQSEIDKFLSKADPWLIAAAMQHNGTVVTQETLIQGHAHNRIKIPNVCKRFKINYINIFELLRHEKVAFRL